jgi:uncharacterized protein YjiS (DUF1127 family)
MRASKLSAITTLRLLLCVGGFRAWFVEWRNRAVSRSELCSLSDDQLWDLVSRAALPSSKQANLFGEIKCPVQAFSEASASG